MAHNIKCEVVSTAGDEHCNGAAQMRKDVSVAG